MQHCYNIAENRTLSNCPICFGRQLQPLTLGHWHLMEEMEIEFDNAGMIQVAAMVCSFDKFIDAVSFLYDENTISDILNGKHGHGNDGDCELFSKYIKYWLKEPIRYDNENGSDKRQYVPNALCRAVLLVKNGFANNIDDALNANTLECAAIIACLQYVNTANTNLVHFGLAKRFEEKNNG